MGSDVSTSAMLAYPERVRVLFSMEVQISHPCSRHLTFRVVRHITNMLSSVCSKVDQMPSECCMADNTPQAVTGKRAQPNSNPYSRQDGLAERGSRHLVVYLLFCLNSSILPRALSTARLASLLATYP